MLIKDEEEEEEEEENRDSDGDKSDGAGEHFFARLPEPLFWL